MNVLLYAISCWLLFLLLCELFQNKSLLFPLICSLLYTAHPIHTEVVNNIKSRDEILCFLFGILSIYLFVKYYRNSSLLLLISGSLSFFLSLISKETGITFLLIIPLSLLLFENISKKKIVNITIILISISVIYFLIRMIVLKDLRLNTSDYVLNNSLNGAPDYISRQATAFYILLRYILLLIFPHPLSCDYNFSQIKIHTLSDPLPLIGILFYAGITLYAFVIFRKNKIISFAILFYLFSLAPVSNIFFINGTAMAERFLYIPSLGFCFVLTTVLLKLTKTETDKSNYKNLKLFITFNKPVFLLLFVIVGLYSVKTFSRSQNWKDNVTIYGHDVEVSKNSASAHFLYAYSLIYDVLPKDHDSIRKDSIIDKAIIELNKSIKIAQISDYYRELGHCYDIKKDYESAISSFKIVIQNDKMSDNLDTSHLAESFYKLGSQMNAISQFDKAINNFDSAIKYAPNLSVAYNDKGVSFLNKGDYKEALPFFEKTIALDPKCEKAYMNMGCVYSNTNQYEKAFEYFNKAIELDSTDTQTYYFMSITYKHAGNTFKAKEYFEKATNSFGEVSEKFNYAK